MFSLFRKNKKKLNLPLFVDMDNVEPCLPDEYIQRALKYYNVHQEHVHTLMLSSERTFEPYWEDKPHPSLWKGGTWRWFFGEYKV